MDTALEEIALVLFTTIAPAGVMGYLVVAGAIVRTRDDARATACSRYLVVPLVLSITGLIVSATHLGTPANALYVLTGIGRSPLSNEVIAAVGFLALGGVYWILSFRDDLTRRFRIAWLAATGVAGLVFIGFISVAYAVPSVPTWDVPTAPATLWLNALVAGPLVGMLTLAFARQAPSRRASVVLVGVSCVAALADVAVLAVEWFAFDGIVTTATHASDLVPAFPLVAGAFLVLVALGVALCAAAALRETPSAFLGPDPFVAVRRMRVLRLALGVLGTLFALGGCFVVRFTFYMAHMTLGV